MWADLIVNGTALSSIGGIASFDGIEADGPLRGENITYPGVAGDTWVPKVRGAYVFTVPLVLLGTSPADFQDRLDDLRALCDSSAAPLALERRRTTGAGDISETADGDYLSGLQPTHVNLRIGRVALDLVNLSGGWS